MNENKNKNQDSSIVKIIPFQCFYLSKFIIKKNMFTRSNICLLVLIALVVVISVVVNNNNNNNNFVVAGWLGCNDPPKWDPHMIDTALKKFYDNCNGKNWPSPYGTNWVNPLGLGLCALDGDVKKHPSPNGVQCVIGGWHKTPPEADGGLQRIEMYHGKLTGTIPDEFKAFQMVDWIGFWNNSLEGNLWDTSYHCFLHRLDLSHNKMSGVLDPKTFFSKSQNHLELLNLAHNGFSGPLPPTLNNLKTLGAIVLNNNKFSGVIPDLSHLTQLRQLNLANNELSGGVGLWLKELSSLSVLNLDNNNGLSGALPDLPSSVTRFQARNTGFSGAIPASYGELPLLRHFDCTGCKNIKCPSPGFFNHLAYSSHCKEERKYQ